MNIKKRVFIIENAKFGKGLALDCFLTGLLKNFKKDSQFEFNLIVNRITSDNRELKRSVFKEMYETATGLYSIKDNIKFTIKTLRILYRENKREKINILHVLYPNSSLLAAVVFKVIINWRVKILYDVRSPWIEMTFARVHIRKVFSFLKYCIHLEEFLLLRFVNYFVFITKGLEKYYKDKYKLAKIESQIIPTGTDLSFFTFLPEYRRKIRKKYKIDKDVLLIGYQGSISQSRELLSFFKYIFKKHNNFSKQNIKFMLVGDGDQLEEIKTWVENEGLDDVFFIIGMVTQKELIRYMSAFDYGLTHLPNVFVFRNSFSLKILEYLAVGCPVLASDIKAHREIKKYFGDLITIYKKSPDFNELKVPNERKVPSNMENFDFSSFFTSYRNIYKNLVKK